MFCKKCGSKLEDGAKFCRKCGHPVDNAQSQQNTVQRQSGAGQGQQNAAQRQSVAGQGQQNTMHRQQNVQKSVNAQAAAGSVGSVKPKKSGNPGLIIGIIGAAVAVIIIIVAAFLLLGGDDSNDDYSIVSQRRDDTDEDTDEDTDTSDSESDESDTDESGDGSESGDADADNAATSEKDQSYYEGLEKVPYAFSDEEWTLLQHGAAYLILLLDNDYLSSGQVVYTKDLNQSQLNSYAMMYLNNNYYDELEALFPSNGSANSYIAYDAAVVQDLVKAALGYEDYEPSEETGIKVSNGIVSYAQASGAPLYVTRRYDVIKQEKLYTVDVEMAALANVSYWVEGLYRLTMMEDDTNPLGYRITSVQKINNSVTVSSVDASSTLTEGSNTTKYHRNNVTDHSMLTAWVEGASGNGIGESITLNLDGEQLVHGFRIASGYMKSNTTYNENAAPTKLGIELSGGVYFEVNLVDDYHGYYRTNEVKCLSWGERAGMIGQDASQWDFSKDFMDTVSFGAQYKTSYIKITILDVKSGSKFTDTCISEILPY